MRIPRHLRSTLAGRDVDPLPHARRPRAGALRARRLTALGALALAMPLAVPGGAGAEVLDAASRFTVRFDGALPSEQAGLVIANVGDQNGDARPDFAIGVPEASNQGRDSSGSVYILYSPPAPGVIDLAALTPAQGYRIDGAEGFDLTGSAVAPAGDVNGDGVMDILIGAPGSSNNDRSASGTAWVVFGGPRAGGLDLAMAGGDGFAIDGARAGDTLGAAVAAAGDVNGDGNPDFMIGAPGTDSRAGKNSGSVYLVYGPKKGDTTSYDLIGLNAEGSNVQGYRVDGGVVGIGVGTLIANVGDHNRDGVPDMAIGVPGAGNNNRGNSGSVFVVFGRKTPSNQINLLSVGGAGYRVDGGAAGDSFGQSLAGLGDVNGDGAADLLVGAPSAGYRGRQGSGSAYVIFSPGRAATVDTANLGIGGFRIDGATAGEAAGTVVAAAGDVNGDGRPDAMIGAPGAGYNGRESSGSAYLVTIPSGNAHVDLAALGTAVTRVDGAATNNNLGLAVASAGDQNGDGAPDMLIGAPSASNNGRDGSGSVYVVPSILSRTAAPAPPKQGGGGPPAPGGPVLSASAKALHQAFLQVGAQPHRAQYNMVLRAQVKNRRAIARRAKNLDRQLPIGGNVRISGRTIASAPARRSATAFTNLLARGHLKFVHYDGVTYAARNGGRFRAIRGQFGMLLHSLAPSTLGHDPANLVVQLGNVTDRGYKRIAGTVTEHYRASFTDAALKTYMKSAFTTLGFSPRLVPTALRNLKVKRNVLDFYVQRKTGRIVAQSLALDVDVNLQKLAKQRRLGSLPKSAVMAISARTQVKLTAYGRKVALAKPKASGRATLFNLLGVE